MTVEKSINVNEYERTMQGLYKIKFHRIFFFKRFLKTSRILVLLLINQYANET